MKILFVVLAIIGVMGLLGVAGAWYAWHRAKQVVASKGIDLNSFTEVHQGRSYDACALLSKEDLSQILSLNVDRAEGNGKGTHSRCTYYSSGAQERAQEEAMAAKKKIEEESKAGGALDAQKLQDIGKLVRGITGAAGASGDAPMLSIEISSGDGKAVMTAFKLAMGLTGAAMTGTGPNGTNLAHEEVKGVGDEAMFGPMLSISMFRQGDVAVQLDGRMLPGGREAQLAIAKHILSKL